EGLAQGIGGRLGLGLRLRGYEEVGLPAAGQARTAEQALEEAAGALNEARSGAAQKSQGANAALAAAQQEAAQKAGELARQAAQGALSSEARKATEQALGEAGQAMQQAESEIQAGKSASAAARQRQALEKLAEAGRAAQEGVRVESEADRQRAEELRAEQERVRKEILDLARRIQERETPRSRPDLARAGSQAQEAEQALEQGDPAQAEQSEEEVERELRQAKSELAEEEEQYQRLRAEEQLFRIAEETATLLEAHRAEMVAVREIDQERAGAEKPTRAQKLRLSGIARKESALGTRAEELARSIEAEGTKVAAGLLANAAADLARIATDLVDEGDYDTGPRVQGLQTDVEEALALLLETLRSEQTRRQNEQKEQQKKEQQDGQKPDGKQPLVPDSTELKLLRRMENDVSESVHALRELYPEIDAEGEYPPELLRELTRLAARHERLTELFRDLRARVGVEAPSED
ncbi:MAG: hypothetical protein ABL998_17435, partial [Planctomycetota bacterium]